MGGGNMKKIMQRITAILVVAIVLSLNVYSTEYNESFNSDDSPIKWMGGERVTTLGHNDNFSLKLDGPSLVSVKVKDLVLNPTAEIIWLDFWIRSPKTESPILIELKNSGYLCVFGLLKKNARFGQGYGTRSSRGSARTNYPRPREVTRNWYTGENNAVKPETWVRFTAKMDLTKKVFDIYRDNNLVFSEFEMGKTLNEKRNVSLNISIGSKANEGDPFYVDDFYLGTKKPEGIKEEPFYPAKPENLITRIVVVGDSQIGTTMKGANMFSVLGTAVPVINKLKPDGVFFVGDLISLKGLKPDKYEASCKAKYAVWNKQVKNLESPYYPIRGNHDPLPYYTDLVKKEIDYVVEMANNSFICYSSAHQTDSGGWHHHGGISKDQLAWIEVELKKAQEKGNRIFVLTHITALKSKHPLSGWYVKEGGEQLRALYKKYGVFMEITGHMHRPLVNRKSDGVIYVNAPTIMEGGGMRLGHGILVYDILPNKILQYEKIAKGGYVTNWGKWAEHDIPFDLSENSDSSKKE